MDEHVESETDDEPDSKEGSEETITEPTHLEIIDMIEKKYAGSDKDVVDAALLAASDILDAGGSTDDALAAAHRA